MKKLFVIATALLLVAAPAANAQAFLNKLKDKVSGAISERVSEKVSDKIGDVVSEKTGIDLDAMESTGDSDSPSVVAPDQQLQRRRSSTFCWNEEVTPSTAKFPIPLMNEFPKVPSAAELANPSESAMIEYYRAIKRVTLRAEELNQDETCGDEFAEQWREKAANEMAAQLGLSRADFERFCNGEMSEAEQEAVTEKMLQNMMGMDMDALARLESAANGPALSEEEMHAKVIAAMMAVYSQNPGETKYCTGKTPAEIEKILKQKGGQAADAEIQAYERQMTAKDGDAYTKRKDALQSKVMAASQNAATQMLGFDINAMAKNAGNQTNAVSDMMKQQQAMKKLSDAMMEIEKVVAQDSDVDAQFSASEKKKIENLKAKIYSTGDPDEYNPLYLQALESIKSYRLRAAALWSQTVQNHFDAVKAKMPAFIKIIREQVEGGYLPECALWRSPLNVVIEAGDILEDAYSEFPSDYPPMYKSSLVIEDRNLFWPEFVVGANIDETLNNRLFKEINGKICKYDGGKWTPADVDYDNLPEVVSPKSSSWRSSDGKREVIYNADGGWLQLPEGDVVYPYAIQKIGNSIQWIMMETTLDAKTNEAVQLVSKCIYKL